jgi:VanZ family protein
MSAQVQTDSERNACESRWSFRILILALAGIFFLTLYPFKLALHAHPGSASPFRLQGWQKPSRLLDSFLNVLLFVPYGFGLAGLLRRRGLSRMATASITLAAGVLLSYCVEFTQFFIPERDSGWDDVFTNSTGALVGCIFFQMFGVPLLRPLQRCGKTLEAFVSIRNFAVILACYFMVWFALSAHWQKDTSLRDWHSNSLLSVGSVAHVWSTQAWAGHIYELEFWDRALPDNVAIRLTSSESETRPSPDAIAIFEFSGTAPFQDQQHTSPELGWTPLQTDTSPTGDPVWDGKSWLVTHSEVSGLVAGIQKSGRFSIHLRFVPAEADGVDAKIVSISRPNGPSDLEIRQESLALSFWFRNRLSSPPFQLEWSMPRICAVNQPRNIVFSYDGSKLWAYVDGKVLYSGYHLSPAVPLAQLIRHIKSNELQGYRYAFYAIVFFPAGCLAGLAARKSHGGPINPAFLAVLAVVLPSVLLEIILVHVGGQPVSAGNLMLAALMSAAGWIWINLEGGALVAPAQFNIQSSAR